MRERKPQEFIYAIAFVCYCSSHDDFIGVVSDEETAKIRCNSLNSDYLVQTDQADYPYGQPPYYYFPVEITKFLGWNGEAWTTKEQFLKVNPVWEVFYGVPSLAEFDIFPKGWKIIEEYTLDVE